MKTKGVIAIVILILGVILAFENPQTLWVSIPFLLKHTLLEDTDDDERIVLVSIFAIPLVVFSFCINMWFGFIFLVLGALTMFLKGHNGQWILLLILFNAGWIYFQGSNIVVIVSIIAFLILSGFLGAFVSGLIGDDDEKEDDEHKQVNEQSKNDCKENNTLSCQQQEYINEDMQRIDQIMKRIPDKISEISVFNSQLQKAIKEYEDKAVKAIDVAYRVSLQQSKIETKDYLTEYSNISQQYSSELNPVVAASCDATIKKITLFIRQKQDIINKNNADIEKYNQLIVKLQKQYDDECALQKLKEINQEVNTQMEDISDIVNKEEKNVEIQNIVRDIDLLDKEVNERRNYEIQFGQIEI